MTNKAFQFYNDAIEETGATLESADGKFAEATLYNMLHYRPKQTTHHRMTPYKASFSSKKNRYLTAA